MSNNRYVTIELPDEIFSHETEKAYCFQFDNGDWCNVPKSEIVDYYKDDDEKHVFDIPDWLVRANGIEDYVV